MGIIKFFSSCRCNCTCGSCKPAEPPRFKAKFKKLPNPNPENFRIIDDFRIGQFTMLTVVYPDCTNFEGIKILIFNKPMPIRGSIKFLDPHFCEKHISPIARFEPTDEGKLYAYKFMWQNTNENVR